MPSDSTQTLVPTPVTLLSPRARSAACATSPSDTTSWVIRPPATATCRTPCHDATAFTAPSGTRARTVRPEADTIRAPRASSRLRRSGPDLVTRTSTSAVSLDTGAPRAARGIRVAPARRRSVTTSRLSSLRSAGDSDVLTFCSAAIWLATLSLSPVSAAAPCAPSPMTATVAAAAPAVLRDMPRPLFAPAFPGR